MTSSQGSRAWGLRIAAIVAIAALTWLSIYLAPAGNARTSTVVASRQAHRILESIVSFNRSAAFTTTIERVRWLPTMVPPDRVEVNTATALLQLFRNNVPVFTTRVIVGGRGRQTPEFEASIESVLFNPSWYVPPSIATSEILPKVRTNPGYLRRHNMIMRNGSVVQLPGPDNALGQLKFEMPNPYDVYLHDTPLKHLFNLNDRRQSHGCVRVQNPRQLAALLLHEPIEAINDAIALGSTHREFLANPMPVFIFYGPISAAGSARRESFQSASPVRRSRDAESRARSHWYESVSSKVEVLCCDYPPWACDEQAGSFGRCDAMPPLRKRAGGPIILWAHLC